jgi:hypothetical protein
MLCSTAHQYRDGIVARHPRIRPRRLSPKIMRDDTLHVAVRHVRPIRECPDRVRGFTLVRLGEQLLRQSLVIDIKGNFPNLGLPLTYHIIKMNFTMQMFLRRTRAPHIIGPIGCSSSATSAVSSTSSFGGLNPNRSFGFFFAHAWLPFARTNGGFRLAKPVHRDSLAAQSSPLFRKIPVRFDLR